MPRQRPLSVTPIPSDPHVIWQRQHLEKSSWSLTSQDLTTCFGTAATSRRFLIKLNEFATSTTLAWPNALHLIQQEQIARRTSQKGSGSKGVSAKDEWSSTDIGRAMARLQPELQGTRIALADKDVNGGTTKGKTSKAKTKAVGQNTRQKQRADELEEEEDEQENAGEEGVEGQDEEANENGGADQEDEGEDQRRESKSELAELQELDGEASDIDFMSDDSQESPGRDETQNFKRRQSELEHTDNRATAPKKLKSSGDTPDMPSKQNQPLSSYLSSVFASVDTLVSARLAELIGHITLMDNRLSTLRSTLTSLRSDIEAAKTQVRDSQTRKEKLIELMHDWDGFDHEAEEVLAVTRNFQTTITTHERSHEEIQCKRNEAEEELRNTERARRDLESGVMEIQAWWKQSNAALLPLPSALDLGC